MDVISAESVHAYGHSLFIDQFVIEYAKHFVAPKPQHRFFRFLAIGIAAQQALKYLEDIIRHKILHWFYQNFEKNNMYVYVL